jgi:hypothetical protein
MKYVYLTSKKTRFLGIQPSASLCIQDEEPHSVHAVTYTESLLILIFFCHLFEVLNNF